MIFSSFVISLVLVYGSKTVVGQTGDVLGRRARVEGACSITSPLTAETVDGSDPEDPQLVYCSTSLSVTSPGSIVLGGGQDTIVSEGTCSLGNVNLGDNRDTMSCSGTLTVSSGSLVELGEGDDFVSVEASSGDGCLIQGSLEAGEGRDAIMCAGSAHGINIESGATLNLGEGQDVLTATTESSSDEACLINGDLIGGSGLDEISCIGGSDVGLRVGSGATVDMGDNADTIFSETDIVVDGTLNLGMGADQVTAMGCFRGTVNLGDDNDLLFAKAVSGTIEGGEGRDCYHPSVEGTYALSCDGGVVTLTPPASDEDICAGVTGAPIATLVSIERIGCGDVFVNLNSNRFPSCDGSTNYQTTFDFP